VFYAKLCKIGLVISYVFISQCQRGVLDQVNIESDIHWIFSSQHAIWLMSDRMNFYSSWASWAEINTAVTSSFLRYRDQV